jgi:hypothetical protein
MSDETNATPRLPAPIAAEQMKPDAAQPAPAPAQQEKADAAESAPAQQVKPEPALAEQQKPDARHPTPSPAAKPGSAAARRSAAVTRGATRVARGVTRRGAPNAAAAAAKPAKAASLPKEKVPDYRKLKLNAEDVIGGVRKVNPWKEGTKGHRYYGLYKNGMTVAAAVKAGVPRGYVAWDVAHGFISLKSGG